MSRFGWLDLYKFGQRLDSLHFETQLLANVVPQQTALKNRPTFKSSSPSSRHSHSSFQYTMSGEKPECSAVRSSFPNAETPQTLGSNERETKTIAKQFQSVMVDRRWKDEKSGDMVSSFNRWWSRIRPPSSNSQSLKGMEFSVMSYNVLSQKLLQDHPYLYQNCYPKHLDWRFRGPAVCFHIRYLDPDILCLQEMEADYWHYTFIPFFKPLGYSGVFKKRTGDKTDGCAIMFKVKKFTLIKSVPVEFCRGGLLDRDNVGMIAVLRPLSPGYKGKEEKICVATTHLLFNPRRGDVKLAQLMLLLAEMDKHASYDEPLSQQLGSAEDGAGVSCKMPDLPGREMKPETLRSSSAYCPTILCGDFNLEPFSPLYKFIAEGRICYDQCFSSVAAGLSEGQRTTSSSYFSCMPRNLLPPKLKITERCRYAAKKKRSKPNSSSLGSGNDKRDGRVAVQNPNGFIPRNLCYQGNIPLQGNPPVPENRPSIPGDSLTAGCPGGSQVSSAVEKESVEAFNTGTAYHSFGFKSAYTHEQLSKRCVRKEASTNHFHACCTVDYIFYSSGCFRGETDGANSSRRNKNNKVASNTKEDCEKKQCSAKRRTKKRSRDKSEGAVGESEKRENKTSKTDNYETDKSKNYMQKNDWVIKLEDDDDSSSSSSSSSSDVSSVVTSRDGDASASGCFSSVNGNTCSNANASPSQSIPLKLELVARYNLFTSHRLSEMDPMPNAVFPSDHLCLLVKFVLR